MKKVCVIGGSGFLGSHLADYLSESKFEVTIFDLYKSKWLNKKQKMVLGDITNLDDLIQAIEGCEYVYNFAGISDLNQALFKPIETVKLNILGNVNVLEACKIHKVKRYIYASSQYVNSREGGFYRCSKQSSELYVEEYKNYMDYTILRFGSLYGPRAGKENGIFNIIFKSLKNKKISYKGNANSIREYIHVYDAAKGSIDILSEEFKNKIVVLTGQQSLKVKDVLYMLNEILDLKGTVEFSDESYLGHYVRTPYAFEPRIGLKYNPRTYIDLGQGLLNLVSEIKKKNDFD